MIRSLPGLGLAAAIAAAALFLGSHYGAPAMLFALLIGMAFHFLDETPRFGPGVQFSAKTVLRVGVALLGIRLSFADLSGLGWIPVATVAVFVAFTLASGVVLSRLFGRHMHLGLLTGGAVGICGASAALAIAAVLPRRHVGDRDVLFTVIAVTTLSTIAMIAYPLLAQLLGLDERATGFLIGATIHDVAQVVGAGYSVSPAAGDIATLVKLERVALLPVVLVGIMLVTRDRTDGGRAAIRLPWFLVAFVALMAVNSLGLVPDALRELLGQVSRGLLVVAIAALGVQTSLKAMVDVGGRHLAIIIGETLLLLAAVAAWLVFLA